MPDPKKKSKSMSAAEKQRLRSIIQQYNQNDRIDKVNIEVAQDDPEFDNPDEFYAYYLEKANDYIDPRYAALVEMGQMEPLQAVRMSTRINSFPNFDYVQQQKAKRAANPIARPEYYPPKPKKSVSPKVYRGRLGYND